MKMKHEIVNVLSKQANEFASIAVYVDLALSNKTTTIDNDGNEYLLLDKPCLSNEGDCENEWFAAGIQIADDKVITYELEWVFATMYTNPDILDWDRVDNAKETDTYELLALWDLRLFVDYLEEYTKTKKRRTYDENKNIAFARPEH